MDGQDFMPGTPVENVKQVLYSMYGVSKKQDLITTRVLGGSCYMQC